jgi:hypothetical protein
MNDRHQNPSAEQLGADVSGVSSVSSYLRDIALADQSLLPPDRLKQAVMAEWDRPRASPSALAVSRWAVAISMAVIVVVAGWILVRTRAMPVSDPVSARRGSSEPGTSSQGIVASQPRPALAEKTPLDLRRRSRSTPAYETEQDVGPVTEFVALDPFHETMAGEDLQMFRVRLSRAALPSLGWPIEESASGVVEADVLMGTDGVARAIRFVK